MANGIEKWVYPKSSMKKLLVDMNVKSYRFSLSWSRLMPDGKTPNANQGKDLG